MSFTPLARAINYTPANISRMLKLIPRWHGEEPVTLDTYLRFVESRHSAYTRTYYQFVAQLGLVYQNPDNVRINTFLNPFDTYQLQQYLRFWFKTYYGPNPYINSNDTPIIIYRELLADTLNSLTGTISFNEFLHQHDIYSGSNDILLNAVQAYADLIVVSGPKTDAMISINDVEKAQSELILIDTHFRIPDNHTNREVFFERYSEENFNLFTQLFNSTQTVIDKPYNRLINGAPGTGKSYMIQEEVEHYLGQNFDDFVERETFHLTYSYQQFVGTYKPVPLDGSITYDYVPGPFLRHLVKAIKSYELDRELAPNYIFIIEEINRAKNPDAVFGNIFQLLDRNSNGKSKYEVTCTEDLKRYLISEGLDHLTKLYLPPNFYIWATMNNADQGVQALDSAFFRRWDPEYISIDNKENEIASIEVDLNGYGPSNWNNLRKELNRRLLELGIKEDKLIGPFFIDPLKLQSNFDEIFKNKLLRYLFEDVLKFKRNQFFGAASYFQQVVESYEQGSLQFIGLNESSFLI